MALITIAQAEGCAVESICRVLCDQGCQIAARTYGPGGRRDSHRHGPSTMGW
jgi:hypothetical protein